MTIKSVQVFYAGLAYLLGLLNLLYIMGFLIDFGVPKGISDGEQSSVFVAVLIDFALIGLFGLHHSITARSSFKRWWVRFVPAPIERTTYLYMTLLVTALLIYFWRPIPITIWQIESSLLTAIIIFFYVLVWVMMLAATFHFGHFEFFGIAQAWQTYKNSAAVQTEMTARYLYALVRHPISLGWMIAPLIQPHLTVGHVVFSAATVCYILAATPFEENDLINSIGKPYQDYRKRVPAFLPFLKLSKSFKSDDH